MFQESKYSFRSGENRGFPWPSDFAGVAQRAGNPGLSVASSPLFLALLR